MGFRSPPPEQSGSYFPKGISLLYSVSEIQSTELERHHSPRWGARAFVKEPSRPSEIEWQAKAMRLPHNSTSAGRIIPQRTRGTRLRIDYRYVTSKQGKDWVREKQSDRSGNNDTHVGLIAKELAVRTLQAPIAPVGARRQGGHHIHADVNDAPRLSQLDLDR